MKKTHGKRRTVPYRRKREDKTDYHQRLSLLKSGRARLVVRRSLTHMVAQLIEYAPQGDKVIVAAHTRELKQHGYNQSTSSIPSAYLLGALLAKKAKGKVNEAILDLGIEKTHKGGRLFAVLKGALDGGLQVEHDNSVLPTEERINGDHLSHKNADTVRAEFTKAKGALL